MIVIGRDVITLIVTEYFLIVPITSGAIELEGLCALFRCLKIQGIQFPPIHANTLRIFGSWIEVCAVGILNYRTINVEGAAHLFLIEFKVDHLVKRTNWGSVIDDSAAVRSFRLKWVVGDCKLCCSRRRGLEGVVGYRKRCHGRGRGHTRWRGRTGRDRRRWGCRWRCDRKLRPRRCVVWTSMCNRTGQDN